ncbi:phosphoenolpyruvate carboxykinase (GTP) [Kineococcus radiotolerans]|uniref:Phosphoenolpyruvate carboxykinase [GTP] n=1 Tax=Kineococcus radiotolerans TaxID=131568 RepID=A0A7W4XY28_KINRA|nr:phosphoenolpyruvate carboxykinase (GTP) [Kineococcus radiotolerans]MBB2901845.1 phosphoenolpyruvate carboxykinase (GTP) [Kineococcus radiotolerans]
MTTDVTHETQDVQDTPELSGTPTTNPALLDWVRRTARLTQPDRVVWCDGSQEEFDRLTAQMVATGTLIPLNPSKRPGSFLARSAPGDVARVERRTFIASRRREDAGPTNNWREPDALREELDGVFTGSMRGRTMYVVPFSMGPVGGPLSLLGVQVTDSPYAVVSMRTMTRMGSEALAAITEGTAWVPGVHSVGMPLVDDLGRTRPDVAWPCNDLKHVAHFPETREIWSFGSGYGGNALLGKKCLALRIASAVAREEGWLAEHMLLVKVTSPQQRVFHLAAAFPSACGKTNLAMMRPALPGWRVETIGDDIAWMRPGPDGRLRAINPEAGFFGVAPGTGWSTNPTAMEMLREDVIFTNVALTDDGDVWWEGMTEEPPAHLTDWRGNPWTPDSPTPAAHPNARFTVAATRCPSLAAEFDDPEGVPVDAILFGGRRRTTAPLVAQAGDWSQGVFAGASISSERTAAAEGAVGELRHDPFAMLPFTGYHVGDHLSHWLSMRDRVEHLPAVFSVNWFRRGEDGRFLWPGFGENARVLEWICGRLEGTAAARHTPAGLVPAPGALDVDGLDVSPADLAELLSVDAAAWLAEADQLERFFAPFGAKLPAEVRDHLALLRYRLDPPTGGDLSV